MTKQEFKDWIEKYYSPDEPLIDMWDSKLQELPDILFELEDLTYLDLADNELTQLSPEIAKLKNLQVLNLKGNSLKSIPKEIGELKNLEALFLEANQLSDLPEEIYELTKLNYLSLNENRLKRISPNIANLENLKELIISDNELVELPIEIATLKYLTEDFNFDGNHIPIDSPFYTLSMSGVYQYYLLQIEENISILKFKVKKELKRAIKTYLSTFTDYILDSKDKSVKMSIIDSPDDFIELRCELPTGLENEEIDRFFKEYMNFISLKEIEIEKYIEVEKLKNEAEFLKLKIENQKNHFEQTIKIEMAQNKMLSSDKEFLQKALIESISSQPKIFTSQIQENFYLPAPINVDLGGALDSLLELIQPNTQQSEIGELAAQIERLQALILNPVISTTEVRKDVKLKAKLKNSVNRVLGSIKNAKTVLLDSPKVLEKTLEILGKLRQLAESLGGSFSNNVEDIKTLMEILKNGV